MARASDATGTSAADDLARDLRANGVRLIAGSLTDPAGVTRAKYVPVSRLGAFERSGMGCPQLERVLRRLGHRLHAHHRRHR